MNNSYCLLTTKCYDRSYRQVLIGIEEVFLHFLKIFSAIHEIKVIADNAKHE